MQTPRRKRSNTITEEAAVGSNLPSIPEEDPSHQRRPSGTSGRTSSIGSPRSSSTGHKSPPNMANGGSPSIAGEEARVRHRAGHQAEQQQAWKLSAEFGASQADYLNAAVAEATNNKVNKACHDICVSSSKTLNSEQEISEFFDYIG